MNQLSNAFESIFEIVSVDSPELFEVCAQIRYEVLCQEGRIPGFAPEHYPCGLENDEYDDHARNLLLKHRSSECYIGTVRMIFSDSSGQPFAIEACQEAAFYPGKAQLIDKNRHHMAEISRLMILPAFRRRQKDHYPHREDQHTPTTLKERRRLLPMSGHPILGLLKAIIMVTAQKNLQCWCSLMEPELNTILNHMGIHMTPIGPDILFHGKRRVYFAVVADIVNQVQQQHREIWTLLTDNGTILPGRPIGNRNEAG